MTEKERKELQELVTEKNEYDKTLNVIEYFDTKRRNRKKAIFKLIWDVFLAIIFAYFIPKGIQFLIQYKFLDLNNKMLFMFAILTIAFYQYIWGLDISTKEKIDRERKMLLNIIPATQIAILVFFGFIYTLASFH